MTETDELRKRIFEAKAEQRKVWAKAPFEEKLMELLRLQRINLEVKKSMGRMAPRPWNMPEEQYENETKKL